MGHDSTKVQMGVSQSSVKEIDNRAGAIAAGLAVVLKSDGTITTATADGAYLGISMGRSLSDTSRTAIARKGLRVPIQLTNSFTPTIGAQVIVSATTGKAASSGTSLNATYVSASLTGIDEDGAALADGCALIDFPGGL